MIYVGTCGYSYPDWIGSFYAPGTKPGDMLAQYARRFPAVEIDSTYYGLPSPRTIAAMNARTPAEFRFTFKAPGTVTHPRAHGNGVHEDARVMCERLAPLAESGKLACVLLQFPHSFGTETARVRYLEQAVDALSPLAVVVEFRSRRWQNPAALRLLCDLGAGYCNVDLPGLGGLPRPSSEACGRIGYVRLHGRNAKTWWRGTNVTRYDYLYAPDELQPWADRTAEIEAHVDHTYVFFNNHANGKAAANAGMLEALLIERYAERADEIVARRPLEPVQPRLDLF